MTGFCLGAAALIVLLAWMLKPARAAAGTAAGNLGLLRAEWSQLDAELNAGRLSSDDYLAARNELQRRVLAEAPRPSLATHPGDPRRTWLLACLGVPVLALLVYGGLGRPSAIGAPPAPAAEGAAESAADPMLAMVDTLAQRLADEPALAKDVSAWTLLARTSAGLQRFAEANSAYARAIALSPNDVQLLADRADVLAMLQGGRLAGEPQQLIERALALDPNQPKALALAGSAAFERDDKAAAIGYWQRARQQAPAGSAFAASIDRSLAAAQSAAPAAAAAQIEGRATLAASLAGRVAPGDTVFVSARAIDGPRMPLAVLRRTAGDLPFDFRLDDSMAMSPAARLSSQTRVLLSVRISHSGEALPQSGDLFGQAEVDTRGGGKAAITIDTVQP